MYFLFLFFIFKNHPYALQLFGFCVSAVFCYKNVNQRVYTGVCVFNFTLCCIRMYTHTDNKQLLTAQQRHTKSLLEVTYAASMLMSSSVKESWICVCVCWYECVSVFAPQRHDKQTQTEGRKPPSGRVRCAVLLRFCEYLPIAPHGANKPCDLLLCSFVLVHLLIFMLPLNINAQSQY